MDRNLIGSNIVLTIAHNLCHLNQNWKHLYNKKVIFFLVQIFNLFDSLKSLKTLVPENYVDSLNKEDKDNELL